MALATTVSGAGKLIGVQVEGSGNFSYFRTVLDGANEVVKRHTVSYTELRETRKWYSLTEGAVTAYLTANPSENANGNCVNEIIGAWELLVESVTRTIVNHAVETVTESE